ncbi:MAG: GTPase domain-containing protein [Bacteroidales bacterium]|nr:GTPase domain-containing protein [Bacteroidales bacterium]
MPPLSLIIDNILDRRLGRGIYIGQGRLQLIESKIKTLTEVQEKVEQLDALVSSISKEIENKQGVYYNLLNMDPETLMKFNEVSCDNAKRKIKIVIEELKKLKSRFTREALRIAFIGRERQGKSTFLKTITGLSDKVIPAYSGNSCTGAVSVIHNSKEPLKVIVEYYTVAEFLCVVKEKLTRFFPDKTFVLGRLEDIARLDLPEYLGDGATTTLISEYNKFKGTVVDHYNDYCTLIGAGKVVYTNENEIAVHVAQYEEFSFPVEGAIAVTKDDGQVVYKLDYYKYLAVKGVDIYKKFDVESTEKLELVDTIGIGSSADSALIEEEMYRVLREDCDAAVDLFRADKTPNYPQEQTSLLDNISKKLSDRNPSKWIVYVLNKVTSGMFKNEASTNELLPYVEKIIDTKGVKPVAWVKAVDGNDFDEVSTLLINPLLNLITENLDDLDNSLMNHAEELARDAYNECLLLLKAANAVTSASIGMSSDILSLFDEKLFKELYRDFAYALNQVDELGYAKNREKECGELESAYNNIIKEIDRFIPDERDILDRFMTGASLTQSQLFEEYVEQIRNDIFSAFEDVNSDVLFPLQEKVKNDIVEILYNQGRMKYLPVNLSVEEGASINWMKEILDNYIDEDTYPYLYKAIKFILDYQINIEGLVEYNVTKSLYVIDRTHKEFIRFYDEYTDDFVQKASNVWQELCNRIMPVSHRLKTWIKEFSQIPSHSFYSRVHKFHVKLMTDYGGVEDIRRFYRKNMGIIWNEDVMLATKTEKAFGDWTERVKSLQSVVISESFKIN